MKSTKPLANPSLTSPLKLMWIPTQESDEHKSGNMSVSTDLKAHSLQSSHSTSQAKLNALNAITVAVQELDIKSNIFKAVSTFIMHNYFLNYLMEKKQTLIPV